MRRAIAALGVAAVLVFSGCSADDGYSDATAQSMQEAVLAVTQASSDGDWEAAQHALDDAAARLDDAIAAGEISSERAAEIATAIAEVRADLLELITVQQQDSNEDKDDKPGNGPPDKDKDKDGKKG